MQHSKLVVAAALLALAGCTRGPVAAPTTIALATPEAAPAPAAMPSAGRVVRVSRDPGCSCCEKWVEHLQQAGYTVQLRDEPDMVALKRQLGIPANKASCHTAVIDGYVFEGHVPAEDIERFLSEKPKARGLLVPGMPMGSPGMEMPGMQPAAYTVERLEADGSTTPYAQHGG